MELFTAAQKALESSTTSIDSGVRNSASKMVGVVHMGQS